MNPDSSPPSKVFSEPVNTTESPTDTVRRLARRLERVRTIVMTSRPLSADETDQIRAIVQGAEDGD